MQAAQTLLKFVHCKLFHLKGWCPAKAHQAPEDFWIAANAIVDPLG